MPDLNALLPGIRFVVVGGTATGLYMAPRVTKDVDILVPATAVRAVERALSQAGATLLGSLNIDNPLVIHGRSWKLPDGTELDVLWSARPWVRGALSDPQHDAAGLPIISLPYLVLMKLASARGVDLGDLSRMLGGADEGAMAEVRAVVRRHLPDALDDVESLAAYGRWELESNAAQPKTSDRTSPASAGGDEGVRVREHERKGRRVREHTRRRPTG